ncbi:ricin-type beta-trefoil lectin protein [Kineococcus xinjiangensis]|uniref:Ricin-type beta-trefoil lectin protein n=1 Tax=Kineococcus xinjiangensis TaxID=512762 RepID=A0A2S6IEB5_9ACTN|nr:RICIN domain-containing protein [Kineococcus xinjiangensis]PPK92500.1 ricin-type beta-trefoil lectin protein [Kineococcus xinjiangensis]
MHFVMPASARPRLFGALAAVVLGATALVVSPATQAAAADSPVCYRGPSESVYYKLTNVATGKVLDVKSKSTAAGARLVQYSYNGGTNQQWRFVCVNGGAYKIVARHSGQVIDVPNATTAEGAFLQQWPANGSTAQAWYVGRVSSLDSGHMTFELQNLGNKKVIDVAADGVSIVQSTSTTASGNKRQQWIFDQVATVS